jgi:[histone H4]-N-methyl-L-lysine20 N-methyltransferase
LDLAATKLLAIDGLRKFHDALKTGKEKDDFRRHLRRYAQIYLPDSPFEVSTTNRYTIVTYEAAVTARRFIKRGESIKYLSGIPVMITAKEEEEMTQRKKDFSIVVSSRNKCTSLFMGPARFANHDCDANARLVITSQSTIEIFANRDIFTGDEITVTYGDNYFGEDNCECLCHTCEKNLVNGWEQPEGDGAALEQVQNSIEEVSEEGYSLRRRRRADSTARDSRTPSRTPDIRPRISRSRTKTLKMESSRIPSGSPAPESLLRQKRRREIDALSSPPITPVKRQRMGQALDDTPIPAPVSLSRRSCEGESSSDASGPTSDLNAGESVMTDVTTPEEEVKEPQLSLHSPDLTPVKPIAVPTLKMEESYSSISDLDAASGSNLVPRAEPLLPSIESALANGPALATGIPAAEIPEKDSDVEIIPPEDLDRIVIPPPLTPASKTVPTALSRLDSAEPETPDLPTKRSRGRPKGGNRGKKTAERVSPRASTTTESNSLEKAESPAPTTDDEENTLPKRFRRPGDYTLTPLLLSEAETAWILCTICNDAFVQHDAYFTRSACPRCERHSKLYGYQWPKTQKDGKHDKEERILDHREIHRFLDPEDEAKIRGRKYPYAQSQAKAAAKKAAAKPIVKKKRSIARDGDYNDTESGDEETGASPRTWKKRQVRA